MSRRREQRGDTCRAALAVAKLCGRLYKEPAALVHVVDEVDMGIRSVLGRLYADGLGAKEAGGGERTRNGGGGVEDGAEGGMGADDEVRGDEPVEEGAGRVVRAVHADGGDADWGIE